MFVAWIFFKKISGISGDFWGFLGFLDFLGFPGVPGFPGFPGISGGSGIPGFPGGVRGAELFISDDFLEIFYFVFEFCEFVFKRVYFCRHFFYLVFLIIDDVFLFSSLF